MRKTKNINFTHYNSKKKKHSASFNTKVVLEALKERNTLSELASKYEVSQFMICRWKKELSENSAMVFNGSTPKSEARQAKKEGALYAKIGRLGISKGQYYYTPGEERVEDLEIMNKIDEKFTDNQTIGVIKMTEYLKLDGYSVVYRRIRKFMRKMGIYATFPKPNLSKLGLAEYIPISIERASD